MLGLDRVADITRLERLKEFDNHELVSLACDDSNHLTAVIAIHRAHPDVPSFGATRFWHYASSIDGVKDALRLSRLMSYKAALAGLNCGGAKGVIISRGDPYTLKKAVRDRLLRAYATRVNLLGGRFVTGIDVGIRQEDLGTMSNASRHIVGFNGNSTEFTALGVFESIRAALQEVFGDGDFSGRSVAIQGLGKVGSGVLALLYEPVGATGKIYVADIDPSRVESTCTAYPRVIPVMPEEIDAQQVDVFVPCALSGAINTKNAKRLQAKIVAGGANNQLENEAVGAILHERKILYVPDYVANAGGLIAVFDEYKHPSYDRARVEKAVLHIPETLRKIFAESRAENTTPNKVANSMAEQVFNNYHDS
ncbi:MAG: hypothetical protein B7X04_02865 [Parcubacteria group bacterium 21-54-25]|nr:MAG: hypothetical protein B7X04_02865 [Parcubacteria group bacterium 21-54-25]HQU07903.1 Glu/Leu/Phe/Val dehydrogenase dimerization domain-containing protein [Candidatus Paceibacterota bacterium]